MRKPAKKPETKITLTAFEAEQREHIAAFVRDWRQSQDDEGEVQWPDEMAPGDWDEQFTAFMETRHR